MRDLEKEVAVLKLSSALVLADDGLGVDHDAVAKWSGEVAEVNEYFHPLIVVGGAVGEGRGFLARNGMDHTDSDLQALASYGTSAVSLAFRNELIKYGIKSGQVLANHNQMKSGSVLMKGLLHGILHEHNVYNMNENDQESLFELMLLAKEEKMVRAKKTGVDNDPLAAGVVRALIQEARAERLDPELVLHLAMFTKIGGFAVNGEVQSEISAANREAVYVQCNDEGATGSGGMRVKTQACFEAYDAGAKTVVIASPEQNWLNLLQGRGEVGKYTAVVQ